MLEGLGVVRCCALLQSSEATECVLQVATDTRLWLYGALQDTRGYLADLIKTAINRAELDVDVIMPGFTHLQV